MNLKPIKNLFMLGAAATTVMAAVEARLEAEAIKASFLLPLDFTVTAHSGCEGTMPNSIESIKKAIESGADIVEMDITKRADGTLVLLHSSEAPENEGVLLKEAFEFVRDNSDSIRLNLDLKRFDIIEEVEKTARECSVYERCFFTGVWIEHASEVAATATIPYYINVRLNPLERYNEEYLVGICSQANMFGAIGINCQYAAVSKKAVEICRRNSLKVSLWTVDSENMINHCLNLLPDNISTNNPQTVLKKLRRK